MTGRACALGLVLLLLATGTGCIRTTGTEGIRRDLSLESGVELDKEFGLTVTRSGMWLARTGLRFSDEDDISLRGVKRLEIGVYNVVDPADGTKSTAALRPPKLTGWDTLVRLHESGESVLVMTHEKKGRIHGMLVVVAEDDEWVLVKLKGKLERILEDAMELAFDEAERPELFAKAAEQLEDSTAEPADVELSQNLD